MKIRRVVVDPKKTAKLAEAIALARSTEREKLDLLRAANKAHDNAFAEWFEAQVARQALEKKDRLGEYL